MTQNSDMLRKVQDYQNAVLLYEGLHAQVNQLIHDHGGTSEQMPPEALAEYRALARRRDEAMNDMRWLEQQILTDD